MDIPLNIIDECNKLSNDLNETMFIFDSRNKLLSLKEIRDTKLDLVTNGNKDIFHINNEKYFGTFPSMLSYYDTETKVIDRYEKYNIVLKYLKIIGFISGENNFGPEFEEAYFITIGNNHFILRLKPNLFINLIYQGNSILKCFFNRKKILNTIIKYLPKEVESRDFILENILNEKTEY